MDTLGPQASHASLGESAQRPLRRVCRSPAANRDTSIRMSPRREDRRRFPRHHEIVSIQSSLAQTTVPMTQVRGRFVPSRRWHSLVRKLPCHTRPCPANEIRIMYPVHLYCASTEALTLTPSSPIPIARDPETVAFPSVVSPGFLPRMIAQLPTFPLVAAVYKRVCPWARVP